MKKITKMITMCAITGSLIISPISLAKAATVNCSQNNCNTQTCTTSTKNCITSNGNCITLNNNSTAAIKSNCAKNKSNCTTANKSVKVKKCSKVKKCTINKSTAINKTTTTNNSTTTNKNTTTNNSGTTNKSTTSNTATTNKNNTSTVNNSTKVANTTSGSYTEFQNRVVALVNKERAAAGLKALTANSELNKIANLKSEDMAKLNYFSHTSPTYGSPFEMLKQFGVNYTAAGENIAMGQTSPEEVMNGWMNSAGHRANILNSNFTKIGVGIAKNSKGQLYWTQTFIR